MNLKNTIKYITPPILLQFIKYLIRYNKGKSPEYEFIPEGWKLEKKEPKIKGWNVDSVLDAYKKNWPVFVKNLEDELPFGLSPESNTPGFFDLVFHNTLMVFAYSIALASYDKPSLKMLDWGGGIGHYFLLAKKIIPQVEIDYFCKDVQMLADYGQSLFPNAHFSSNESYCNNHFDFILASSSLHYVEDWQSVLSNFANCADGYVLLTRVPITLKESYVFVQRPYQYGYQTEYLSWAINRTSLLESSKNLGFQLIREFITGERPNIINAPSPCENRAFLFQKYQRNKNENI